MKKRGPLRNRSVALGVEVLKLSTLIRQRTRNYPLADQLSRSGTAPGAMIAEAVDSESVRDKIHKFSIALKEARETEYWLELIETAEMLQNQEQQRSLELVSEVIAMLVSSLKTLRSNTPSSP